MCLNPFFLERQRSCLACGGGKAGKAHIQRRKRSSVAISAYPIRQQVRARISADRSIKPKPTGANVHELLCGNVGAAATSCRRYVAAPRNLAAILKRVVRIVVA